MRTTLVVTMLSLLVLSVGCDLLPRRNQPQPEPAPKPAAPAKTEDFQGYYLTVSIGGSKTDKGAKAASGQRWSARAASNPLVLEYSFDQGHLGKQRAAQLTVNPKKADGSYDLTKFYKCVVTLEPGKALTLNSWQWFDGAGMKTLEALPAGEYSIKLQVTGEKTWDRQEILITVK